MIDRRYLITARIREMYAALRQQLNRYEFWRFSDLNMVVKQVTGYLIWATVRRLIHSNKQS